MQKKLFGLSLMATLATTLTVAFAAVSSGNTTYALNRNITYNETVNISCPFGTEDGSNYLTLTDVNGTPNLGLSKDPELLTIEFNYNTGDFKFPLSSGYVYFQKKTITPGGTTMKYKNGICSGNSNYALVNHNDVAEYSQATTNISYLIPYYSAKQYTGWCLKCGGHKAHFKSAADALYNLVINKEDVAEGYRPQETPVDPVDPEDPPVSGDVSFAQSDLAVNSSTITKGGVTLTNTSSYTAKVTELRIYKNQTLTISSVSNITNIAFTCTGSGTHKYGPGCFAALEGYSYNDTTGMWTGSSKSIAFTASSNQVRITQIVVTLA